MGFADVDCDACKHPMSDHKTDGYGGQWCEMCFDGDQWCRNGVARRDDLNDRVAALEKELEQSHGCNVELIKKLGEADSENEDLRAHIKQWEDLEASSAHKCAHVAIERDKLRELVEEAKVVVNGLQIYTVIDNVPLSLDARARAWLKKAEGV